MDIEFLILENGEGLKEPCYETKGSSGMDLRAAIFEDIILKPMERRLISTGIAIALSEGFEAQIRPRSGLANKFGITILNSPGTIDSDYRGEIKIILINLGQEDFVIKRGDRIAQMVISSYERIKLIKVEEINKTARDNKGFGSTGAR